MSKVQVRMTETQGDTLSKLQLFERNARSQGWAEDEITRVRQEVVTSSRPDLVLAQYVDDPDQNLLLG